jgi:agmatine deiminase
MSQYPTELSLTLPAEWENHRAVWLAWPWDASLWKENLAPAQKEFVELCQTIQKQTPSECVYVVCPSPLHRRQAERALGEGNFRYFEAPYGDIWLRDTAPIYLTDRKGGFGAVHFQFNGWGGKYLLKGDDTVGKEIGRFGETRVFHPPFVLEGGSIDSNGQGLCLTTRQCLLNPNRNPGMTEGDLEQALKIWLGQDKVLWLEDGLVNDHTDGHIDNIARFVSTDTILCMKPSGSDDPNAQVLAKIESDLRSFTNQSGQPLRVVSLSSPGKVLDADGNVRPASYMNFYIANGAVIAPLYGSPNDDNAVATLQSLFPTRKAIGLRADHILSGGGSFHCITQQYPGDPVVVTSGEEAEKDEEAE